MVKENKLPELKWHYYICVFVLLACSVFLYAPSYHFDFTIDDPLVTTINSDIKDFNGDYKAFFERSLYSGTTMVQHNDNLYRPVLLASTAANYQLAGYQFNPVYFHVTNVILYAFCVVMVFIIFSVLLPGAGKSNIFIAFLSALLFMVFPSHLESVCNIKHREEIMACLFVLLSWGMILQGSGNSGRYIILYKIAAPLFFLLALLTKESALLIVPVMILFAYLKNDSFIKITRKPPVHLFTFSIAIIIYFILRYNAIGAIINPSETNTFFRPDEHLLTRILITSKVFVQYYFWDQLVGLELDPAFSSRFLIFHHVTPVILDIAATIILSGLFLYSGWLFIRKKSFYAYLIMAFFITSFLAMNIVPIGTAGAFRLMFTPSVFICLLIILTIKKLTVLSAHYLDLKDKLAGQSFLSIAIILISIYGYVTYTKMHFWQNDGAVFTYSASIEPDNPISHYTAGQYYEKKGDITKKYAYYQTSLDIFLTGLGHENLFNEKNMDVFSVVATEIAHRNVNSNPEKAIELADLAIEQFNNLTKLRQGLIDSNIAGPYYVKALALKNLGKLQESVNTCHTALAITNHRGIVQLLQDLEGK